MTSITAYMRPTDVACVFYRHETLGQSEPIKVCEKISDVFHTVEHHVGKGAAAVPTSNADDDNMSVLHRHLSALAHQESLSMMASYAGYTVQTRSHIAEDLSEKSAELLWKHAAHRAAASIFGTDRCTPRRRALVMGVYITRTSANYFTVGIVTQGDTRDARIRKAITTLSGTHKLTRLDSELQICAAHRSMSIRLWWEPRSDRVTPRSVMPPIRVILEREQQELSKTCVTYMTGYGAVNIFLCRPVASKLLGTTRKLLNTGECHPTEDAAAWFDGRRFPSCAKETQQRRRLTVVLHFNDLHPVEVGEHLVGVEVEPLPPFRPFVPSQYAHLPPFLVVGRSGA
ncbi:hypothetical protein, conserved [Trypanosoma brucei gambiense DAL972]|uniref:Uncharacterized protein n=1 Tax=Trypanosoma brucei gambiense (strain MHOM/CI/86/DAL972) TaxID=679716 RepID=D0AAA8_TRYB9|nr:hypothetical protein, conserved [Trypanosoma brucei gambiense DAL972]CBH18609.1 hypothetical protein, conserved [Trypanosoma brucei gambiense DAL972]|eukprot:XP_011780873.1 hypothetical protein, conserved [Trypanosoma brucei gambiense DAL972]